MSAVCISQSRIHTTPRSTTALLLLVAIIIQLCPLSVCSNAIDDVDWSSHAIRVQQSPHRRHRKPDASDTHSALVPTRRTWSPHLFTNRCSNKLMQLVRGKTIDANGRQNDTKSQFVVTSVFFEGQIQIQHSASKRYLCFNEQGKIKVKYSPNDWCTFEEISNSTAGYYMYRSHKNKDFYLGFNRSGKKMIGTIKEKRRHCYTFQKSSSPYSWSSGGKGTPQLDVPLKNPHRIRHQRHRRLSSRRKQQTVVT